MKTNLLNCFPFWFCHFKRHCWGQGMISNVLSHKISRSQMIVIRYDVNFFFFKWEHIAIKCDVTMILSLTVAPLKHILINCNVSSKISYCSFFLCPSYVNKINQSINLYVVPWPGSLSHWKKWYPSLFSSLKMTPFLAEKYSLFSSKWPLFRDKTLTFLSKLNPLYLR